MRNIANGKVLNILQLIWSTARKRAMCAAIDRLRKCIWFHRDTEQIIRVL